MTNTHEKPLLSSEQLQSVASCLRTIRRTALKRNEIPLELALDYESDLSRKRADIATEAAGSSLKATKLSEFLSNGAYAALAVFFAVGLWLNWWDSTVTLVGQLALGLSYLAYMFRPASSKKIGKILRHTLGVVFTISLTAMSVLISAQGTKGESTAESFLEISIFVWLAVALDNAIHFFAVQRGWQKQQAGLREQLLQMDAELAVLRSTLPLFRGGNRRPVWNWGCAGRCRRKNGQV